MQLISIFVAYGKISLNPEAQPPRLDKESPLSFYDDVLVEVLCKRCACYIYSNRQENPHEH